MKFKVIEEHDTHCLMGYDGETWWYILQIEENTKKVYLNTSIPPEVGLNLDKYKKIIIEQETR